MSNRNDFYQPFDSATFGVRTPDPYRTQFQIDRDRVIHSYAFRRLQAKTQVFKPGEYDFYRTRLTHTIEVTQIGRSICNLLLRKGTPLSEQHYIDPDLVEVVCLAHDVGHPPFGHVGERTLNDLMADFGGFEANAQTLRLLTETIRPVPETGTRQGIQPTRALLDGVLKYKQFRANHTEKFIYDEQKSCLDFVFPDIKSVDPRWKSIECQIMDWADEVAYSVGDFVDGARARIITVEKLNKWESSYRYEPLMDRLVQTLKKQSLDDLAADKIGEFIEACDLSQADENPLKKFTNRYILKLNVRPEKKQEERCLAEIAYDLLFQSPEIQQLEYKADKMLRTLFEALMQEYVLSEKPQWRLLKKNTENSFDRANGVTEKARLLCDYVSGMSDEYAVRTYRRLVYPAFGSIVDLV